MLHSKRDQEGYLLIDHRLSPGSTAVPEGKVMEAPTMTCCHCGNVVILNPLRTRPRHYCQKCDNYVCDTAACVLTCRPFAQLLDETEKKNLEAEAAAKATIWLPPGDSNGT